MEGEQKRLSRSLRFHYMLLDVYDFHMINYSKRYTYVDPLGVILFPLLVEVVSVYRNKGTCSKNEVVSDFYGNYFHGHHTNEVIVYVTLTLLCRRVPTVCLNTTQGIKILQK